MKVKHKTSKIIIYHKNESNVILEISITDFLKLMNVPNMPKPKNRKQYESLIRQIFFANVDIVWDVDF